MRFRAAAALLVTLLALTACSAESDTMNPATKAGSAATALTLRAPDGMRLVGLGRAVVAVPRAWGSQETYCGLPTNDTVYFFEESSRSCLVNQKGIASLAIAPLSSQRGREGAKSATEPGKLNGVDVLTSDTTCKSSGRSFCAVTVVVPSEDATFFLRLPREHVNRQSQVAAFPVSLHLLATTYTTVPFIPYGISVEDAKRELAVAGLRGESPDVDWPHYATGTVPPAGTVVAVDDVVELSIGDG